MTTDGELLREYAETLSEEAFGTLVRRHLDLVYSAALRQLNGDSHLAQDVAQTVFSDLARKASALSGRRDLAGWLYTSTHFAAAKAVRSEQRRRARESEAQAMQELLHSTDPDFNWEKLRPVLDRVMHELKEVDREVILMRYFENRQLADIGEKLGVGEDAARKRVDRALEKLRSFLIKRGIATTAALATALSVNAVQVAPAGLAATLTTASIAGVATGTATTVTILKLMTMTKLQAAIIGALIVAGVATPLMIQRQTRAREENESLLRQVDELSSVKTENERLSNLVVQASRSPTLPADQLGELLRLRGEVGNLRRQTNELLKLQAENLRLRTAPSTAHQPPPVPPADSLPRESWAFAGFADPESGFQSAIWARSRGDVDNFVLSLAPGKELQNWQNKSEEEMARLIAEAKNDFAGVTGFKVMGKEMISDDQAILTVFVDGINQEAKFQMQKVDNEWKLTGPVKGKDTPKASNDDGGGRKLVKQSGPVRATE